MNNQSLEKLTQYWTFEIVGRSGRVSLEHLHSIPMPEVLRNDLLTECEKKIDEELETMSSSRFLAQRSDAETREKLRERLSDMITLPEAVVRETIQKVFSRNLTEWVTQPLSLRMAMEDPQTFTDRVFKRVQVLSPPGEAQTRNNLELISKICDVSGLDPLGSVLLTEREFGTRALTREAFARITLRYLKLKETYSVGRSLVADMGTARTLADAAPVYTKPEDEEEALQEMFGSSGEAAGAEEVSVEKPGADEEEKAFLDMFGINGETEASDDTAEAVQSGDTAADAERAVEESEPEALTEDESFTRPALENAELEFSGGIADDTADGEDEFEVEAEEESVEDDSLSGPTDIEEETAEEEPVGEESDAVPGSEEWDPVDTGVPYGKPSLDSLAMDVEDDDEELQEFLEATDDDDAGPEEEQEPELEKAEGKTVAEQDDAAVAEETDEDAAEDTDSAFDELFGMGGKQWADSDESLNLGTATASPEEPPPSEAPAKPDRSAEGQGTVPTPPPPPAEEIPQKPPPRRPAPEELPRTKEQERARSAIRSILKERMALDEDDFQEPSKSIVADSEVPSQNKRLYEVLMGKKCATYFGASLFKEDHEAYQQMVKMVCLQKDMENARITADNALYIQDVESTSRAAQNLFIILRKHFEGL
ncbi:hypothetical protein GF324_05325 [bacterium]|nr:hypothetical protein [bacterium]